jgi:hypothetical protein
MIEETIFILLISKSENKNSALFMGHAIVWRKVHISFIL